MSLMLTIDEPPEIIGRAVATIARTHDLCVATLPRG
jgi:hypothetical protein